MSSQEVLTAHIENAADAAEISTVIEPTAEWLETLQDAVGEVTGVIGELSEAVV
jgi:hypothetical protein